MMVTPKFWSRNSFLAHLLLPFSVIYFLIKRLVESFKKQQKTFGFFSIIVGNAVLGGAGKTPTCAAIAKIIRKISPDKKLCIITKGYGGTIRKPTIINTQTNLAKETGDEPQILAKICDVIVSYDRLKGAEFAEQQGYKIVIFDDGLHDKRIKSNIALLVIDGKYGNGNGMVFPAGPLRDRFDIAANSATHIIIIGKDEKKTLDKLRRRKINKPTFRTYISNLTTPDKAQTYIAFAGIGRPEKFFDMLRFEIKLKVVDTIEFPDHHNYENDDLEYIKSVASKHNARILTTEKDYVKLPELFRKECEFIEIELKFDDNDFEGILQKSL